MENKIFFFFMVVIISWAGLRMLISRVDHIHEMDQIRTKHALRMKEICSDLNNKSGVLSEE